MRWWKMRSKFFFLKCLPSDWCWFSFFLFFSTMPILLPTDEVTNVVVIIQFFFFFFCSKMRTLLLTGKVTDVVVIIQYFFFFFSKMRTNWLSDCYWFSFFFFFFYNAYSPTNWQSDWCCCYYSVFFFFFCVQKCLFAY